MYLLNAISANMLADLCNGHQMHVKFTPITEKAAGEFARAHKVTSAVGHSDTARIFANVLGVPVPMNRISVWLEFGEKALLGQYNGPRLPKGATELPEGAYIQWVVVEVD